jgi:enamine deaminase RidA (YjgF/YER057c/UK114 family)
VTAVGGRIVFLAGQTALDPAGSIVAGGIVEQFERALANLLTALDAAGGTPEHLAKLTVYATDPEDYRNHAGAIGEVWRRLVGPSYPAMALIGIVRLWDVEALVELEGIAVI